MGRKKLEMKRIEDKSSRQVTFTKRRGGLIKKARELSVLCDVDVALVVFSTRGKLFEFSSSPSVTQSIQRYSSHIEAQDMISTGGPETESRFAGFQTSSELLEIIERQLKEPHVDQHSVKDLILIENQIDAALSQIRSRKTQLTLDSITSLREKEKLLTEENKHLVDELDAMGICRNSAGELIAGDSDGVHNHIDSYSPWLTLRFL